MPLFAQLGDLTNAVKDECQRATDTAFATALPRFVASAETRMFDGATQPLASEPLRLKAMEASVDLTLASGDVSLPADYLEAIKLFWGGSPRTTPDFRPPDVFHVERYTTTGGSPVSYTIEGNTLKVSPMVSGAITLSYYARPSALVNNADSNAVLTSHPMLYFHAVCIEAYAWLRNDERRTVALSSYVSTAGGLNAAAIASRASGNRLAPVIPGWRVR